MSEPDLHTMNEDEVFDLFFESLKSGDWDTAKRMFRDLHGRASSTPDRGGILADQDIVRALEDGRIRTHPEVEPEQVQPVSLDIRMGEDLVDAATGRRIEPIGNTHEIVPWRLYHAGTMESISIADDIAAQLAGRSSFAREGLVVHLTAGWVDAGWSGVLTMEMFNFGPEPVYVDAGERVAQLVFYETKSESSGYSGAYAGADRPEGSKR